MDASRCPTEAQEGGDRAGPARAGLPRPVVDVVFAGAGAVSAEGHQRRVRRVGGVDLRVNIERRLVVPEFEHELSGSRTLQDSNCWQPGSCCGAAAVA